MSRAAWVALGGATSATAAAAVLWPGRAHAIVAAWALTVLAWGLLRAVGTTRLLVRDEHSAFERALFTPAHQTVRPDDLARCERIFGWKSYPARDFDHHVRPLLKELVEHRIGERGKSGSAIELAPELEALMEGAEATKIYGANVSTEDVDRILQHIEKL